MNHPVTGWRRRAFRLAAAPGSPAARLEAVLTAYTLVSPGAPRSPRWRTAASTWQAERQLLGFVIDLIAAARRLVAVTMTGLRPPE
jgi:hypothetical protein